MKNHSKKRWTEQEKSILSTSLVDNIEIDEIAKLLPNRNISAIKRKAQDYRFSSKTENGICRFKADIKRRNRKSIATSNVTIKKIVGEERTAPTVQVPTITTECIPNTSDVMIANNFKKSKDIGLDANSTALKMLKSEHLPINADIVYKIASYIEEVSNVS